MGGVGGVGAGGRSVEAMVSKLGSQRVSHIFTHLRKVSQHPLLVRAKYSDQQVWGKVWGAGGGQMWEQVWGGSGGRWGAGV